VVAAASSLAPRSSPLRILDLYAGAGETALPLAAAGHDVVMVELDQRAVVRAETRARHQGVALRCIAGRVEHWVARLLPADVVIVNPPRSGLAEPVARALTPGPRRLVYVSCDPATLARDLSRVGASPERLTVRAYDMFPQTSHVETVVVADLGAGDRGSGIGAPRPPTPDP
jgi:tRNA/tmRNA/rRNA uracil-C5-methylase (TrmA/RlmC/RlmD family)